MRPFRFLVALLAVVLLHSAGTWLVPEYPRASDLFLVLTVLVALRGDPLAGLLAGLGAGLTHDVFTAGPFALHGFADTAVGFAVARLAQRLVVDRLRGVLLMGVVASVVQQVILVALVFTLLPDVALPEPQWMALRAGVAGVVTAAVYAASGRLREGLAERRRRRHDKLHLD